MLMLVRSDARYVPLRDGCVQTCVTSPPYWGLRDYGTATWDGGDPACDHIHEQGGRNPETAGKQLTNQGTIQTQYRDTCRKCGAQLIDRQLGLESTPDAYVQGMVAVFREVWRVLRDDGTCWLNLGDSYAGSGKGAWANKDGGQKEVYIPDPDSPQCDIPKVPDGLKPKDLVGIPWRVAFALQADGWYLRSDIIWSKPNPMPESVTDRPTKAHEYVFLLSKSERYYFDADAVREPNTAGTIKRLASGPVQAKRDGPKNVVRLDGGGEYAEANGRNIRSVWHIATQPTSGIVRRNARQVRVSWDESDGDTTRITSPSCPVHGDQAVRAAMALCGGHAVGQPSHTSRSDAGHAPTPLLDYAPTDRQHADYSVDETTDSHRQSSAQIATARSSESRRTGLAPVTTAPCIASAETTPRTGDTSGLQPSSGAGSHTRESSTQAQDDPAVSALAEMAVRTVGTLACSCDYYRIETEKIDHFATMPEKLVERCVLAGSKAGDVILDPFVGSGTVARVALRLGRKALGLDLNHTYLELADDWTLVTYGLPFGECAV